MILLKNGTVHTMESEPFVGDVLIKDGKISLVQAYIEAPEVEVYDLTGCHVIPGIIDAHCHIGMWEDGMGDEGADGNEISSPITPQLLAIDGLNPFDPCFDEAVAAGVTTVVTGPGSANVIGGQFAALKTHGETLEDRLIRSPIAMKAALGENPKNVYGGQKATPYTRMAIASLFRKAMVDAQEYRDELEAAKDDPEKKPERSLEMEALLPVLSGELPLKFHAHRADDILTGLRLAKEFNLKVSIDHCTEGHLIAKVLKEQTDALGAGVIVGPLLCDRSKIELRNLSYGCTKVLHDAGIEFALMTDHPVIPVQYLPVCAGLMVREGLDEETALACITKNAAKIVGLSDRIGRISAGLDADIAVYSGHPFDYRAVCRMTLINGEIVYEKKN